ncbi:hypothetical protein [Nocardioides sp. 503]|uniref:hypothetical protein n=1 Tax=Nocardioides sp. 503 TaxID=2508326 RepID=UPI00106FB761|nr:hypothetical protein [Nocardioides sp. 503]
MNPAVQSAIVSSVVGLLIWYGTNRANRRSQAATNALESRKVDQGDKSVNLSVLKESLDALQGRVDGLVIDLNDEKRARMRAERRAEEAEQRAKDAERRAGIAARNAGELAERSARLEERVAQLEDTMRATGIAIPPPLTP